MIQESELHSADRRRLRFIVAQLGARMHYAIPRILAARGLLERFFTDFWLPPAISEGLGSLARIPGTRWSGKVRSRSHPDLPQELVTSYPYLGARYWMRRMIARSRAEQLQAFLQTGIDFGGRVCRAGFGSASAVYCYDTAGLEILEAARAKGLHCVIEQTIAPRAFAREILRKERQKFPEASGDADGGDSIEVENQLILREQAEWALADVIVCGSRFVSNAIASVLVGESKCIVVPYGVDAPPLVRPRNAIKGKLKILFVGELGLRKGALYLLDAASRLGDKVELRLVGGTALPLDFLRARCPAAQFIGAIPRQEVGRHYAWADVLVLPSLIEGSATVVYEALAHGLPVICTPNTGSVVADGREGYVVEAGSVEVLAAAIERLLSHDSQIGELSRHARMLGLEYSIHNYGERLLGALVGTAPVSSW